MVWCQVGINWNMAGDHLSGFLSSPGYDPPSKQITDTYKVFVSPKKMYLEPFLQRGLTDYHRPCSYSVCSYGPRVSVATPTQDTLILNSCILQCMYVIVGMILSLLLQSDVGRDEQWQDYEFRVVVKKASQR